MLLFETGLLIAGSIGLLLLGEKTIFTELSFLSETITFSISNTALLLTLGIFFALSVLIYRNSLIIGNTISRFQATLLNLSLTFGFVALMSGQFMIRYIALDIVGLLVALTVLNSFSEKTSFKDFAIVFQILRLGDLSLLVSILLINQYAGTLDISLMINAASDLRMEPRMWVFMGFLFAILIKLAIWPFGAWLQRAKNSVPLASFWISGFLMPTLGYYLLYRIIPIINSSIIFQSITFLSGLLLIFILLIATHLRLTAYKRFYHIGSIFSCFSLLAVAFSSHDQIGFYLFGLILYRLILFCQEEVKSPILEKLVLIFPLLINGMYLWANAGNLP
ncbi:MAG: proton-conducting transporter membrane subunit, partial [Chloroflexota bacterium]|nr:proton-conducting transporter membrane subunit [Chloroflexota bacterium]